jgi:hypothetical protein
MSLRQLTSCNPQDTQVASFLSWASGTTPLRVKSSAVLEAAEKMRCSDCYNKNPGAAKNPNARKVPAR